MFPTITRRCHGNARKEYEASTTKEACHGRRTLETRITGELPQNETRAEAKGIGAQGDSQLTSHQKEFFLRENSHSSTPSSQGERESHAQRRSRFVHVHSGFGSHVQYRTQVDRRRDPHCERRTPCRVAVEGRGSPRREESDRIGPPPGNPGPHSSQKLEKRPTLVDRYFNSMNFILCL